MSFIRHFRRIQYIDFMIRRKATGTPKRFAEKNCLSKSGLMIVLKEMKELGFPICYDRNLHTYLYNEDGEMVKQLFKKTSFYVLSKNQMKNIKVIIEKDLCFSSKTTFESC